MNNKSNTGLIILVVVLLIIAGFVAYYKGLPLKDDIVYNADYPSATDSRTGPNGYMQTNQNPTGSDYYPNGNPADNQNASAATWPKSPKFGLYYPEGYTISEQVYLNASQQASHASESQGIASFSALGDHAVISWGGAQSGCSENQFGTFSYGVSTSACLNGMRADIGIQNVRNAPLSQAEINIFGDFIRNNQK